MTASSLPFESGCSESRLNLNMYGVFGISTIRAILAPQMQGPCTFMESPSISVKYDKFWRFGFKSNLQTSLVQRIYFPDKLAHLWSFRPRLPKLPKLFQLKQLMWKMCKPTRRSLQQLKLWARPQKLRRWGKWSDCCGVWRITLEHFGSRAP